MFRSSLLAMLTALAVSGCVSTYAYRDDDAGGDYYYAEPSIDTYYDNDPYYSLGYHYPYGLYGSFGYGGYGSSRYGYGGYGHRYGGPFHPPYGHPYGYYGYGSGYGWNGYPYYYYPYTPHPRQHRPRNPPPPGVIGGTQPPPGPGPGPSPGPDREDRDREGGPWRHLDRVKPRIMTPQPAIANREPAPGVLVVPESQPQPQHYSVPPPRLEPRRPEYRRPVAVPQPQPSVEASGEYRQPVPTPRPRPEPRHSEDDLPRPAPMRSGDGRRGGMQEREAGLDPTP